jgi:hypothetical protein
MNILELHSEKTMTKTENKEEKTESVLEDLNYRQELGSVNGNFMY